MTHSKNNWPVKKLGKVAGFQKGKLMPNSTIKEGETNPYILIDDLRSSTYSHFTPSNQGTACIPSDVLLVWDGAYAGTVGGGLQGFVGSTITKISPNLGIDPAYLKFLLSSKFPEFNKQTHGAAVPHLNKEFVLNYPIPTPPMDIQKKIVERLDAIRKAQELNDSQISKSEELYKTLLNNELFPKAEWPLKTLEQIAVFKRGPFGGSLKKEIFIASGYKVYEQKNAINNDFSIGNYFITKEKYGEMKEFAISPGDLIISCSGTIGKVVLIPPDAQPGIINQALLKLTPKKEEVIPEYLKFLIETDYLQSKMFGTARGSSIKNVVGVKEIKAIAVNIPTRERQQKIVEKLSAVQEYKKLLLKQKTLLRELFDSVLSKCMKGELVN